MARRRKGRQVDGILVLDKPTGISSNAALQTAKRLYFANKAGHTGSLDPLATGVLPVCFGEATKFSQYLLNADKAYRATVVLGATSNTEDADGQLTAEADASALTIDQIKVSASEAMGRQLQVPPMYSALKRDGQRLYELARQGVEVEREAREVFIKRFDVTNLREFQAEALPGAKLSAVDIEVHVSKGTYVRTLAADLGKRLGVGAYVQLLHRIQVGCFAEQHSVSIAQLETLKADDAYQAMDDLLQPIEAALSHIPRVEVDEQSSFYVRRGNAVQIPRSPTTGMVSIVEEGGCFIGVGEIDEQGRVAPRRLVVSHG